MIGSWYDLKTFKLWSDRMNKGKSHTMGIEYLIACLPISDVQMLLKLENSDPE